MWYDASAPYRTQVVQLEISELSSLQPDDLAAKLGGKRAFDAIISVDFLSCLAFGAGLDPDDADDADALGQLDHGLCRVLRPGGTYYDFMVVAPNSQFILRYVPDYCSAHPGRFICVLNDEDDDDDDGDGGDGGGGGGGGSGDGGGGGGGGGSSGDGGGSSSGGGGGGGGEGGGGSGEEAEQDTLLFVTFDASLLHHEESAAGDGVLLLRVPGYDEPFTYSALLDELSRPRRGERSREPLAPESRAFATKVLEFLFRDINSGGCADNWELLSYVYVDPAHFDEVFDEGEQMLPVFLTTFRRAVRFLRDALKRSSASYVEEVSVVEAFCATTAANLTRHAVESTAADVLGADGALYTQRYHTALVSGDGEPDGQGSFRCLMTKTRGSQSTSP